MEAKGAVGRSGVVSQNNPLGAAKDGVTLSPVPMPLPAVVVPPAGIEMTENPIRRRSTVAALRRGGRVPPATGSTPRRRSIVATTPTNNNNNIGSIIRKGIIIKRLTKVDELLTSKHRLLFGLACLSILFMVIDEETRWYYGDQYVNFVHDAVAAGDISWGVFDFLIPALNVVLAYLFVDLYIAVSHIKMAKWGLRDARKAFCTSPLRFRLLAEVAVIMIQPVPRFLYSHVEETLGGDQIWLRLFGLAMFARLYLIARIFRDHSYVFKNRHRAVTSGRFSKNIGFIVALRSVLKRKPLQVMSTSILFVILTFMYCIFVNERFARYLGIEVTIDSVPKALWFVTVTLTTAGYGDMTPSTTTGFYIAMTQGLVGLFLTSFLVAAVIGKLTMSRDEEQLLSWLSNDLRTKEIRSTAASMISLWWRFIRSKLRHRHQARLLSAAGKLASVRALGGGGARPTSPRFARKRSTSTNTIRRMMSGNSSNGTMSQSSMEASLGQQLKRYVKRVRDLQRDLAQTEAVGTFDELSGRLLRGQDAVNARLAAVEAQQAQLLALLSARSTAH